jgi:hypothetical protein
MSAPAVQFAGGQPIRKRKPRGPNLFRQRDVEKAVKAAFAGGATTVRIEVGGVTIVADKSQPIQSVPAPIGTGWEDVA